MKLFGKTTAKSQTLRDQEQLIADLRRTSSENARDRSGLSSCGTNSYEPPLAFESYVDRAVFDIESHHPSVTDKIVITTQNSPPVEEPRVEKPQPAKIVRHVRFPSEPEIFEIESLTNLVSTYEDDDIEGFSYSESIASKKSTDESINESNDESEVMYEKDDTASTKNTESINEINDKIEVMYGKYDNDDKDDGIVLESEAINRTKEQLDENSSTTSKVNTAGCFPAMVTLDCPAIEDFEIQYDPTRFKKEKKHLLTKISSIYHRWKSFREDRWASLSKFPSQNKQRNEEGNHDDDPTLSSSGSTDSGSHDNDYNHTIKNKSRFWGLSRFWNRKRAEKSPDYFEDGNAFHYNYWTERGFEDIDIDILATSTCNEYARMQYQMWKKSTTEGSLSLETSAFVSAFVLLLSAIGMAVFADIGFWTFGGIVSWCNMVVGSLVVLVLEFKPARKAYGKILRASEVIASRCGTSCCCYRNGSQRETETDPSDNCYHDATDSDPEDDVPSAEATRENILHNMRLFRYVHGRGFLCVFSGSMVFSVIPRHTFQIVGPMLAVGVPGIALVLVGKIAILAGVHATFRRTLLEISILGDDDYLRTKFLSAGKSILESDRENSDEDERDEENPGNHQWRDRNTFITKLQREKKLCLDQYGFLVLVTTLGLDLDEDEQIQTIYEKEVKPKDPEAMTFQEFKKWWRGTPHRNPVSLGRKRSPSPSKGRRRSSSSPSRPT